jgi:hypothetical protein
MVAKLTEVTPFTVTTVRARFTGAGIMKADYVSHLIQPFYAELVYVYNGATDQAGWTHHTWRCRGAKLIGYRVLKPGPNGELRVSDVTTHQASWNSYAKDVAELEGTPLLVVELIEQCRPSGEVKALEVKSLRIERAS